MAGMFGALNYNRDINLLNSANLGNYNIGTIGIGKLTLPQNYTPTSVNNNPIGNIKSNWAGVASGLQYGTMLGNQLYQNQINAAQGSLNSAVIKGNAAMQRQADLFNIAQQRKYVDRLRKDLGRKYLNDAAQYRDMAVSQELSFAARGITGGTTYGLYLQDTQNKLREYFNTQTERDNQAINDINFQAEMLDLQSQFQYAMAQIQAKSAKAAGQTGGLLGLGLGIL